MDDSFLNKYMFSVIKKNKYFRAILRSLKCQASNTSNLPCFSLVFLSAGRWTERQWKTTCPCQGNAGVVHFWAFCNFSIVPILLNALMSRCSISTTVNPSARGRYREKTNGSRLIQVKQGFNPWITQYFFSFTTVFLILYLSMLRDNPIVSIGNEH